MFDFNASLNDAAPLSPILFTVDLTRVEHVLVDGCYFVLSLLYPPCRLSVASVVFDFSASLNDVAPLSPMPFPACFDRRKKLIVDGCHLCVVSFSITFQIEIFECCV